MLHCCKCQKNKSSEKKKENKPTLQSNTISIIKKNELLILDMYIKLEAELAQMQLVVKELQDKLIQTEKINEELKQKLTNYQSIQIDNQSISLNLEPYQSLKKIFEELIKEDRITPNQSFLRDILQQKEDDIRQAHQQIQKQYKIILEYELRYEQLLNDYQLLERQQCIQQQ